MIWVRAIRPLCRVALVVFAAIGGGATGHAAGVPPHLASMAKELLRERAGDLSDQDADPARAAMLDRAKRILADTGIRYWAEREIRLPAAAATLARSLNIDTADATAWSTLYRILAERDRASQVEAIRRLLRERGEPTGGDAFLRTMSAFDAARETLTRDLARRHVIEVGDGHDRVELRWNPERNDFGIRVRAGETAPGAGDGFDLRIEGDTVSRADAASDDAVMTVEPDKGPVSLLTDAELRAFADSLYGRWREPDGSVDPGAIWQIERPSGQALPDEDARRREEIRRLEREIEEIRNDKVYRWRNPATGEQQEQKRFRRLAEPWVYEGEGSGHPDAAQAIADRQARIAELQASGKSPASEHDPVGMGEMLADTAGSQPLNVSVTQPNGFRYAYDEARITGGRVVARRTLRDRRDITSLPDKVVQQLIASWSPPEWIEIEIRVDPRTKELRLTGARWRLHVTYLSDDLSVDSIHTPYSSDLSLVRGDLNVAEGAAKDAPM